VNSSVNESSSNQRDNLFLSAEKASQKISRVVPMNPSVKTVSQAELEGSSEASIIQISQKRQSNATLSPDRHQ